MKISSKSLCLLKQLEGCSLKSYIDFAGIPTIAYGHTKGVIPNMTITPELAEAFLLQDLERCYECIDNHVMVKLNQNEVDALTIFIYNIGETNFKNSTLLKCLNKNDRPEAAKQFLKWIYITDPITKEKKVSNILVNRRNKEFLLFTGRA